MMSRIAISEKNRRQLKQICREREFTYDELMTLLIQQYRAINQWQYFGDTNE